MSAFKKRFPVTVNPVINHENELRISLSGDDWRFRLDPKDQGINEKWFDYPLLFQDHIKVPGCWQGQGFGNDAPDKQKETLTEVNAFRATYKGTGWYFKSFRLSKSFAKKRIWLNFGGANPTAEIWVNGTYIGDNHYPFVSFGFDITELVDFNKENTVVVRINEEDHMICFNYRYSGVWAGIYRDVELLITDKAYIDNLSLLPDERTGELNVRASLGDCADGAILKLHITDPYGVKVADCETAVKDNSAAITVKLEDVKGWSPDTPLLYRADAELYVNGSISDCSADRFGFITLATKGKHFLINGEPYYMRGTGDFCENPITGSPNTDREFWRKSLKTLRDYGYNYVRCQSYVPSPEYIDAADEVGLIVQSEMGMLAPIWGFSMDNVYNWPRPTPDYRERVREQWNAVVLRDVNHPSANIYCMSNELKSTYFPKIAWRCYNETKAIKPTSFVIWTDGGHKRVFDGSLPEDFVNDDAEADELCDMPVIQHEFKWWSSFPNAEQLERYKGAAMRNWAAEKALTSLMKHGILHILPEATKNSQALQFIEMKGKLEELRRDNPRLAGVCHFNALDTMGSPQGVIDIFYDKKHATPDLWQQTNGDTVILCDLNFDNRILVAEDDFRCSFSVSDFSHPSFKAPKVVWSFESEKETLAGGEFEYEHKPYCTASAGDIKVTISACDSPLAITLKAKLVEGDRQISNEWALWVFPKKTPNIDSLYISKDGEAKAGTKTVLCEKLTNELVDFAANGGAVIVRSVEGLTRPFDPVQHLSVGRYFFSKPASYPPYEELQSGTIIKDHAMFGDMPHKNYADLLFYNMIGETPALDLEPLGLNDCDPVIRMIHAYQVSRSLGYITERRLGKGLIIITSIDIGAKRPEAEYFLSQIVKYTSCGNWENAPEISEEAINCIISGTNLD